MRYLVVVEAGPSSFGAYVPDLPGCVPVDEPRKGVMELIAQAVELRREGLREAGIVPPVPHASSEFVDVRAA